MQNINQAMVAYWENLKKENAEQRVNQPEPDVKKNSCRICGGSGWFTYDVRFDDPLFGKPQRCTNPQCEAANAAADRALKNYELPKIYRRLTFGAWEALPDELKAGKWQAYFAALAFVEQPEHWVNLREAYRDRLQGWEAAADVAKNSLVFYGPMGVGKTGWIAAIMNALSQKGYTGILYRRTSDALQDLQDAFDDNSSEMSLAQRMGKYQKARVLVLDEFEVENNSKFRLQSIEDIIRYRHGHEMPTLLTTNMTKDESYEKWTGRTADVLAEMAHWVPVDYPKLRGG